MGTWNYRVIKKAFRTEAGVSETYRIHEVYYTDDGTINGWSAEPIAPYGETPLELLGDMDIMLHAFHKPLLVEIDGNLVEDGSKDVFSNERGN